MPQDDIPSPIKGRRVLEFSGNYNTILREGTKNKNDPVIDASLSSFSSLLDKRRENDDNEKQS